MGRVSDDVAKREFADWLSLPKDRRVPKTIKEWAENHGRIREAVSVWQNDPDVIKRAAQVASGIASVSDFAQIANKLKQQAKEGHVPSITALFEMAGVYLELSEGDAEAINAVLVSKAKSGNVPAIRLVAKRQKVVDAPVEHDIGAMTDAELEALLNDD